MILLFVVTRNEAELLRLNLAHHLGWGFDHIAVADNESTDATQDVLREFSDAVTSTRIGDPYERYLALAKLLTTIEEQHGTVDWVAVSDTDEFWWTPDDELRRLLARVPDSLVAINSDQKLFLPTELDSVSGPVYCRRTFRASDTDSPLHTSYVSGKSLYRAAFVHSHGVLNPHWSGNISHARWRFKQPLVHHYMIDDEESFVRKVKGLERWNRKVREASNVGMARQELTSLQPQPVPLRAFKAAWWRVYETTGEAGVRDHYRREYVISASSLPIRLQHGEIVEDAEFAKFKRSAWGSGASGSGDAGGRGAPSRVDGETL
jgi:hypothetical protein